MSVYLVEPEDLVKELALTELVALCEPVVGQLVERFDLAGKTLMSVGAGSAYEEVALLRNGMRRAYLFDIDEHGSIEPALRRISRPDRTRAPLIYFIDDFLEVQPRREELEPIDVLYFSSFPPDELRRGEISEQHRRRVRGGRSADDQQSSPIDRVEPRCRDVPNEDADPDWPTGVSPIHDVVLKAIDLYLANGGLFILQSYCAGVDVLRNPDYVRQWEHVLQRHEVALVGSYCFRAAPAVTLWIGVKGRDRAFIDSWRGRGHEIADSTNPAPLTRFHARAQLADCSISQLALSRS